MNHPREGIRQHGTHHGLVGQAGPRDVDLAEQALDAIIIPAARPALNLDHAITLARAAGCFLLILCSRHVCPAEVEQLLAERSFTRAVVIDLPGGYSHKWVHFPALQSIKDDLPEACTSFVTDLSVKRNVGLVLARMMRWRRIFFLDDDIRDISYADLQGTINMLGAYPSVGMRVMSYPDNSIVCHANRMTEGSQDVFVSGAALAVDSDADIGFFPDIYNEDWLFFYDDAANGRLANSGRIATQLCYYPFANAKRAAWQEFGDVIAEGLYGLLHLGGRVDDAKRDYWAQFIEARRRFLEAIISRSDRAYSSVKIDMMLSVVSALKCSLTIDPALCERYVRLWRQDLMDWKGRAAGIPEMPSIEAALQELELPSSITQDTGGIQHRWEEAAREFTAGPVMIPRPDTLKELAERTASYYLSPATAPAGKGSTKPLPMLTPERAAALRGARTNADGVPSSGGEGHGRPRKRFSEFGTRGRVVVARFRSTRLTSGWPSLANRQAQHQLAQRIPEESRPSGSLTAGVIDM